MCTNVGEVKGLVVGHVEALVELLTRYVLGIFCGYTITVMLPDSFTRFDLTPRIAGDIDEDWAPVEWAPVEWAPMEWAPVKDWASIKDWASRFFDPALLVSAFDIARARRFLHSFSACKRNRLT